MSTSATRLSPGYCKVALSPARMLIGAVLLAGLVTVALPASAADLPGVTATEIKIGNTNAYSGPASSYGAIAKTETAFFKMVNDKGGVAGHKINFISYDDAYSPPKTVEQVRRLIEEDQVALLFNTLGTPSNTAIQRYVNQKKVPHLFISTGADLAILYQNDDFGKDYPAGVKDVLGDKFSSIVVKQASYETTDATVDSQ